MYNKFVLECNEVYIVWWNSRASILMVTLVFIIFFIHVFQHVYSTPEILGFIFKSTLFDLDICLLTSIFRKLLWRLSESNWMSICLFMIIFNEKIVPNYCRLSVSFIILYITTLVRIDYLWMYYFLKIWIFNLKFHQMMFYFICQRVQFWF